MVQNGLTYVTNIALNHYDSLIPLRYHAQEIVLTIELLFQGYYLTRRQSTYGENFYGFIRSPIKLPWTASLRKDKLFSRRYVVASLLFEIIVPYLIQKFEKMAV